MNEITDAQIEEAERILGYYEALVEAGTLTDRAREWTLEGALKLLRELLPEWSAFKADDCTSVGFSGQGRCVEPAAVSRTTEDGQRRSCWEHYIAPDFRRFEAVSA